MLRKPYPLCRKGEFDITVTLVHRESNRVLTHVEAGEQTAHRYGLAVDDGPTTIVMQLVDLQREYGAIYAIVLKNTSLDGARTVLRDHSRLAENIYCVQFASIPDFLIRMQAAKFISHTDWASFPSVQN